METHFPQYQFSLVFNEALQTCLISSFYLSAMKPIALLILSLFSLELFAQSDFAVLKKRGITIQRYYKGNAMNFYTVDGYLIEGYISKFKNDSIFMRLGHTGIVGATYGTKLDTIFYGDYKVHVKDITLIPNKNISAASIGNSIFKIGLLAACVVAGNNINVEQKWKNVIQYTSVIGINILVAQATLFKRKRVAGYQLGKKYKLEYIAISNN